VTWSYLTVGPVTLELHVRVLSLGLRSRTLILMYSLCQRCEVEWTGDAVCWVCGSMPPSNPIRPRIMVTSGAHSWRHDEDGDPELLGIADRAAAALYAWAVRGSNPDLPE